MLIVHTQFKTSFASFSAVTVHLFTLVIKQVNVEIFLAMFYLPRLIGMKRNDCQIKYMLCIKMLMIKYTMLCIKMLVIAGWPRQHKKIAGFTGKPRHKQLSLDLDWFHTSTRTFMVKQDSIAGKHIVSFSVVHNNPVSIHLCGSCLKEIHCIRV